MGVQESDGSGQHHIFTLNNYRSVQQEGTFMNPSSHNSGARESVEVFFGVSKIPIWGWINYLFLIYMFWLIKTIGKKKQTSERAKNPDSDPELSFYRWPVFYDHVL